jgi:hypothetical protein
MPHLSALSDDRLAAWISIDLCVMSNILRILMENFYRKRYLQLRPALRQKIDAWMLPLMVARLREV